jgi:hypothetical protein
MFQQFIASLLAGVTGLTGAAGQAPQDPSNQTFSPPDQFIEGQAHRPQLQNQQGRIGAQERPELPGNWSELSQEEKQIWFQSQGIERPKKHRPELPEGWEDMNEEERRVLKDAKLEEKLGVTLPDNWSELTKEERHDFIQENTPEDFQPRTKKQQKRSGNQQFQEEYDQEPLNI